MIKLPLVLAIILAAPLAQANEVRCDKSNDIGGDRISILWTHHPQNGSAGSYTIKIQNKSYQLLADKLAVHKTPKTTDPLLRVKEAGYWVDDKRLFLELVPSVAGSKFGTLRLEVPNLGEEGAAYMRVYKDGKTRKTRVACHLGSQKS